MCIKCFFLDKFSFAVRTVNCSICLAQSILWVWHACTKRVVVGHTTARRGCSSRPCTSKRHREDEQRARSIPVHPVHTHVGRIICTLLHYNALHKDYSTTRPTSVRFDGGVGRPIGTVAGISDNAAAAAESFVVTNAAHTHIHTHSDTRTCIHTHTNTRTAPVPYGTTARHSQVVVPTA